MSKLFTEQGFLSGYGEETFKLYLDNDLNMLLNDAKTEAEARIIGSLIAKRIGDKVANKIVKLNAAALKEEALQPKHGDAVPGGGFIKFGDDK